MAVIAQGYLRELKHRIEEPVAYRLVTMTGELSLNELMGASISISFMGDRACVACGRKVKKLYQSGYCFPCLTTLAECDLCIVKPHDCHFHLGTCRDETFAQDHCMIPHYVYLAFSSAVKVGLTRKGRQFTRWIDQGASASMLLAEVPTRKEAGELEMEIARHVPDKTDWRKMLKGSSPTDSEEVLVMSREVRERLQGHSTWEKFLLPEDTPVHRFTYPVPTGFEPQLTSLSLDKYPLIEGVLHGVKGQYLLLDKGVLNVRKHAGYRIQISAS